MKKNVIVVYDSTGQLYNTRYDLEEVPEVYPMKVELELDEYVDHIDTSGTTHVAIIKKYEKSDPEKALEKIKSLEAQVLYLSMMQEEA